MKSKLLQKLTYGVSQSREAVDGHREKIGDSPLPWRGHVAPPKPASSRLTPRPAGTFLLP
jgi:hypothetical protein